MKPLRFAWLGVVFVMAAFMVACTDSESTATSAVSCSSDADCAPGERCVIDPEIDPTFPSGGTCVMPGDLPDDGSSCTSDADCAAGEVCHPLAPFAEGGICGPPGPASCTTDSDCPPGEHCVVSDPIDPTFPDGGGTCLGEPALPPGDVLCDDDSDCPPSQTCILLDPFGTGGVCG